MKPGNHWSRWSGGQSDDQRASRGWRLNDRKVERSKWGGLETEVTVCRIQSPHSTADNEQLSKILESKTRARKGGQEGWMCDVHSDAIGV